MAGLGAERTTLNQPALAVADGMFDQQGVGQIPANLGEILKSELVGAVSAVPRPRFLHLRLRLMACFVGANCSWPWPADLILMGSPAGKRATLYRPGNILPRPSLRQA